MAKPSESLIALSAASPSIGSPHAIAVAIVLGFLTGIISFKLFSQASATGAQFSTWTPMIRGILSVIPQAQVRGRLHKCSISVFHYQPALQYDQEHASTTGLLSQIRLSLCLRCAMDNLL